MRRRSILFLLLLSLPAQVRGQFGATSEKEDGEAIASGAGPQLDQVETSLYEVGVILTANSGDCGNILVTLPIPTDWPEQNVRVVKGPEGFSPLIGASKERIIDGGVKQLVIQVPAVPRGQEVRAILTLEITRHSLAPPTDTSGLVVADRKKLPKDVRVHLGVSPYIETKNPNIVKLAKEIVKDKDSAWAKVEAMYQWVRENIEYEEGEIKGAAKALEAKSGDCEELTSLFIALCRVNGIPARMVWVPGHCYPEFYLQDAEKKGYWFPCQAAGTEAFGGIPEVRPILQKGDRFKTPEEPKSIKRYVAQFMEVKSFAVEPPVVQWINRAVDHGGEKPGAEKPAPSEDTTTTDMETPNSASVDRGAGNPNAPKFGPGNTGFGEGPAAGFGPGIPGAEKPQNGKPGKRAPARPKRP